MKQVDFAAQESTTCSATKELENSKQIFGGKLLKELVQKIHTHFKKEVNKVSNFRI